MNHALLAARRLVALVFVASLIGCAASRPVIDTQTRSQIRSAGVSVEISQDEMDATFTAQNSSGVASQFGLIGALIGAAIDAGVNSTRAKTAEERVASIRDAAIGYQFDRYMQKFLQKRLGRIDWLDNGEVSLLKTAQTETSQDVLLARETRNAHLFTNASYSIDSGLQAVTVVLLASLVPKSAELREATGKPASDTPYSKPANAIYRNSFAHVVYFDIKATDLDQREAAWTANNGAMIRKALSLGIRRTVQQLASDMNNPKPDAERGGRVKFRDPTGRVPYATAKSVKTAGGAKRVAWQDGSISIFVPAATMQ